MVVVVEGAYCSGVIGVAEAWNAEGCKGEGWACAGTAGARHGQDQKDSLEMSRTVAV